MAKVRFLYDNLIDVSGVILTESSQSTTLPVENIQDHLKTKVWRTGATLTTEFVTIDLPLRTDVSLWTERANPKNVSLSDVAFGNSIFVAVGQVDVTDAYLITSPDGITWTERANPKNIRLNDIVFGNSLFVAIGDPDGATDSYIITSPDGIIWTERSNPKNFRLIEITFANSLFVAVGLEDGTDAYIVTSPDGITWTERANPKNFGLTGIIFGNSIFVAVGQVDGTDAYLITSSDGITWTERSNPKNFNLSDVAFGNSIFVAVGAPDGTDAYIVTSPDGITWTERSNPKDVSLIGVFFGHNLFVSVGAADGTDAYIITSPDGIIWTERSNPKNFTLNDIVFGAGIFISVGLPDGTDAYIVGTIPGASNDVSCVVLHNHNLKETDTNIKLLGNDTDSWGTPAFTQNLTHVAGPISFYLLTPQSFRFWRVTFDKLVATETRDIGRVFLGDYYEVPQNVGPDGITIRKKDLSKIGKSVGGQSYADVKSIFDQINLNFSMMEHTQYSQFVIIAEAVGLHTPFFVSLEHDVEPVDWLYYVKFMSLQSFKIKTIGPIMFWSASMRLEEQL